MSGHVLLVGGLVPLGDTPDISDSCPGPFTAQVKAFLTDRRRHWRPIRKLELNCGETVKRIPITFWFEVVKILKLHPSNIEENKCTILV